MIGGDFMAMKIQCNVDRHRYKGKPDNPGAVRNRLKEKENGGIEEIEPRELVSIFENGMTIYPGALIGTDGKSWQSQQIIIADIDNDKALTDENGRKIKDPKTGKTIKTPVDHPLTHKEALKICKENGLEPFLMYHTFSNSEKLEKYRVVFVLSQALTDKEKVVDFTARLTALFNNASPECADTTMADAARLIYGGRSECVFYQSTSITDPGSFERLPEVKQQPKENKRAEICLPEEKAQRRQRSLDELHDMRQADINGFDLAAYVEQTTGASRVVKGNTVYFNPCPICGHNDDFTVKDNLFKCFGKDGDIGGNIILYLKLTEGLSDGEALERFNEIKGYSRIEWDRAVKADRGAGERIDKGYKEHTGTSSGSENTPQPPKVIKLKSMTEYTEKEFEWLIKGYIPKRGITIIGADGGTGKGMLWASLIADLSAGHATIFERDDIQSNTAPKMCIYLSSEDNIEFVIKERLRHNNANMSNILSLDTSEEGFELLKIQSPEFEQIIATYKPDVCVLDPLQAFISPDVKMAERNQMRGELHALEKLSGQYGVSFILVMHTNKGNGNFGRKRLADSADLWDIARSVFIMGESLEADSYGNKLRYISHEKVVKGRTGKTILASIQDPGVMKYIKRCNKKDFDFVKEKEATSHSKGLGSGEAPETDRAKDVIFTALYDMGVSKTDFDREGITKEKSRKVIDFLPDNTLILASSDLDKAISENGITQATGKKAKSELIDGGYIKSFQVYRETPGGKGKSVWYTALLDEPESKFTDADSLEDIPFEDPEECEQLELDLPG